ncbi:MAG: class II glutamine amidotransferase [Actinomycetota bacterium]|nr:class II glutamine amidotransferase [Actinomycetota bacterium]MDQ2848044.1 class II glutamine amidotransferase [Actinomycetota bacterium]MDQ2957618.1 class II glutamine amidotransferase [Actinomycetota bacterium]
MCRLLGVVSSCHDSLPEQLGGDLAAFTELSSVHCDGWGIAYWNAADDLVSAKYPEAARGSSRFAEAVEQARTDAALLHLRKASVDMANTAANTHPFLAGSVAFAHNGYLSPLSELDRLVGEAGGRISEGGTDSERYFQLVLAELRQHGPVEALHRAANRIADATEALSLNCLLLTHDALYASARYDEKVILAQDGDVDSYQLRYRIAAQQVTVASVGWAQPAPWQALANGQILQVNRGDLRTSVHALR